ncbi:hypothetical protein MBAV_000479 [Candidatus Magnetobacterium bavaricum]|uniref:Uncharacterized protein n=1 Tax=Candidatus Magnetobacterium bavaricum TaxID=29290 RepID=A0A0F3GZM1_9BACT|nr:hypothetical protein MBAV_000479 [Candidatus Magnetobacterium bavaricum]
MPFPFKPHLNLHVVVNCQIVQSSVSSLKNRVIFISRLKGMDSCFRRNDSYSRFPSLSFLA